jgi:hypothetical protein
VTVAIALARRVLLIEQGAELVRRAAVCRQRAEQLGIGQPVLVADYTARADSMDWLADQLTRLLANGAEAVGLETRHALPEIGDDETESVEVDEPSEGDAFSVAFERADHDRSPADVHHGLAPGGGQ